MVVKEVPPSVDLERLHDAHAHALFAFLLNLTRDEADTRDILKELCIKLARQPELLGGVRNEGAFLLSPAHNPAIDQMRQRDTRTRHHEQLAGVMDSVFAPAEKFSSAFACAKLSL